LSRQILYLQLHYELFWLYGGRSLSKGRVFVLFLFLVLFFSLATGSNSLTRSLPNSSASRTGNNFVKIYFVMLDGVGSYCGYNMSRLLDGVLAAAHNQTIRVSLGFAPGTISDVLTTLVKVNVTVSVVHDWETTKA
jgi:predicted PurR-regulated permease PerM